MNFWAALALVAGGLFAGSVFAFAWDRVPAWRKMPSEQFLRDFGHTINRADKIQPALLVLAIAGAIGFAVTSDGATRVLALVAAGGFLAVMLASLGVMVPLQRRILRTGEDDAEGIEPMQRRWFSGQVGRTVLSVASFVLAATAVSL